MSRVLQNTSSSLQIDNISQIKLFVKSTFFGYSNPILEEKKQIKAIRSYLRTDTIARKYLTKNMAFSLEFIYSLSYIYEYIKSFKKTLPFEPFFDTEEFPIFLLSQFSTPDQLRMYAELTDPNKIKNSIAQRGLYQAKKHLKNIFIEYKTSFEQEQIYNLHKILDLGSSFHSFLKYDLTNLILMLYPSYSQDKQLKELSKNYKPIPLHYITEELESFIGYLATLKHNENYYTFLDYYGQFLNIKIISKKEFLKFFRKINEFTGNNLLLKILKVETKNNLIKPLSPKTNSQKSNIIEILQDISIKINKSHSKAILTFVQEVEESTLDYMFDKQTIQQIKFQQKKFDTFLHKPLGEKSATSISVVLMAFSEKVFYKSIQPTLEFLIKNTVFVLPEFKKDLIYYFQSVLQSFKATKENISEGRTIVISSDRNFSPIETKAKQICKDFLTNTEILDGLLNTVLNIGNEELKNKVQFIAPKDKMEKLLKNLEISRSLIQKMYQYIQISFQTSDIF